jgi:class 3 adenylate cyclase
MWVMNEQSTPNADVAQAAVFADLCDYTRLTEEYGDEAAAEMAVVLGAIARDIARRHNGRVIKMLGDGAHLHFTNASDAVPAAIDFLARVRGSGLPCARVGVNAGPMIEADGDYYGRAVNIAARITAQARPGDVLVGEAAVACQRSGVRFECVGPLQLKGVPHDVTVYRAMAA